MSRKPPIINRRDTRYAVSSGKVLAAKLQVGDEDGTRQASAKALDLSRHGAKLEIDESIAERQHIEIELTPNGWDTSISTSGQTRWIRPIRENVWWMGISFDEPIDAERMDRMACQGFLDRRQDQREPVDQEIVARCELSEGPVSMTLRDFSVGGIGIWSPREINPQSRLLVAVGEKNLDGHPVVARVQWVCRNEQGDGYFAGCTFVAKEGYPELRRQLALSVEPRQHGTGNRSYRYMLGLVAGIAAILAMLNLIVRS